jgi:hypothetical protein
MYRIEGSTNTTARTDGYSDSLIKVIESRGMKSAEIHYGWLVTTHFFKLFINTQNYIKFYKLICSYSI